MLQYSQVKFIKSIFGRAFKMQKPFVYFISYNVIFKNGACGYGNREVSFSKEITHTETLRDVEKGLQEELSRDGHESTRVIIMNFQLLRIEEN